MGCINSGARRPAGKGRRPKILGISEGGGTPPGREMPRGSHVTHHASRGRAVEHRRDEDAFVTDLAVAAASCTPVPAVVRSVVAGAPGFALWISCPCVVARPAPFPAVAVGGARFRRARGVFARASRRRTAHPRGDRVVPRDEGQGLRGRGLAHPGGAPEGAAAAGVFPDLARLPRARGAAHVSGSPDDGDADVDGAAANDGAGGPPRFHAAGPAARACQRSSKPAPATSIASSCRSRDLTSGTETYPAGRYMDLERTPTGLVRRSTSTARITRSAITTRPTTARIRRARTGCRFPCARASA